MKKSTVYIVIAALAGLFLGYLFFGNSGSNGVSGDVHDHATEAGDQMWTCSMHPQIMQPEAGDCPICGMDLIPAESGADGLRPDQILMTENAMALANVQTTIIGGTEGQTSNTFALSGKIAINEEAEAIQASYFDGRIEQLHVNYEGQEVRKGQLLATIYSPELIAAQQELLTAVSLKVSSPQLYEAVRNKLKLWKLSDNQINAIEKSGKVSEYVPVYATVSGTVAAVMSAEGDYIKKGQPITKVSDLNTVWAEFDAYESQLSRFKKGQNISIRTNAYPDKTFQGQVSFISPVLNNATRTVTLRATLRNPNGVFKPGMFVNGEIELDGSIKENAQIAVPASAVMWTGERSLVYVKLKGDQPVFEMREVILGERVGESYAITSGLQVGEEVVSNGTFTVDAAAQLQGKKSMMNPEGGTTRTGHEHHSGMQEGQRMEMELPASFQKGFEGLLPAYLKMKDAFVASDAAAVAREALNASDQMGQLDRSGMGSMEMAHLDKSIGLLKSISETEELKSQRAYFVDLNEHMVALASGLKSLQQTFYIQRCPMANNNLGAVWLSTEKEIRNPYYGDEMLTCGKVEQILD